MSTDVIIIGGGVIGTACAYFLARRGAEVLVLEKSHLAAGASGASAAMINRGGGSDLPGLSPEFNAASHGLILEIEKDFDRTVEIVRGGSLYVALREVEVPEIRKLAEQSLRIGIEGQFLDESEARAFEPLLGPQTKAAFFNPINYHVNPFRLCEGYLSGALRRKGKVLYGIKARAVRVRHDRIDCVVTDKGNLCADWIVVAAGAWTPQVLATADLEIPILPVRGQVILSEACSQKITHTIFFPDHLYVKQTVSGNFYLGSHLEFAGFNDRITFEKISTYMKLFGGAIPLLSQLKALRFFAGFRPVSADNLPVIGPAPHCPRLIIASGHGALGMRYSAMTAKIVSELILDGKSEYPIDAFAVDRFAAMPACVSK